MKIHRFYTPNITLSHGLWLKEPEILHQWNKVLRFRVGQQVVLFDGTEKDKLYKITEISTREAHLEHITDYKRQLPNKNVYLFWSLLKKDKNDWVLQKCTELGVSHFIPLIADRSEKTGFNIERAQKIVIEAAEQCGRSSVPVIRETMYVSKALDQYADKLELFICEQNGDEGKNIGDNVGIFIGPEGGWSDAEKELFKQRNINYLNLHDFTLRAETAAVASMFKLLQ
jgi:16S rRNA (uracil1498-N3)-methyltransferase